MNYFYFFNYCFMRDYGDWCDVCLANIEINTFLTYLNTEKSVVLKRNTA